MGPLLLLGIGILILVLGFGWNAWLLGSIILALTLGIALSIVSLDIESIKANWKNERCRPEVMLAAFLFKPNDDPRSVGEFAKENFTFCLQATFTEMLSKLISPILTIIGSQLKVADVISQMLNSIKLIAATLMQKFQGFLDPMFRKFVATGLAFSQTFEKLLSAMRRVGGIALASVFAGMSIQVGVLNFVDFIIKVVMIILYILVAMVIFLFFLLVPTIPLILITIGAIAAAGIADVGGMGSAFCFTPETKIELADGRVKPLFMVRIGDELASGGKVEGVLRTEGYNETLYTVDDILVSGSHLILEKEKGFLPVQESSLGERSFEVAETIICLRTSERRIGIRGASGQMHIFSDWEELPISIPSSDALWDSLVSIILNGKGQENSPPKEYPLLSSHTYVFNGKRERVNITNVRIGDEIEWRNGKTRVTSIYKGLAKFGRYEDITDGIWIYSDETQEWIHPDTHPGPKETQEGFHLSTEAGTFTVESAYFSGDVRDFTEVGADKLFLTYNYTRSLLKKSFNREEPCAQDSS